MDRVPGDSAQDIERWLQKGGRWFIAYSLVFTIDLVTYEKTGIRMNLDTLPGFIAYWSLTWITAAVLPFWQPDRARWRQRQSSREPRVETRLEGRTQINDGNLERYPHRRKRWHDRRNDYPQGPRRQ